MSVDVYERLVALAGLAPVGAPPAGVLAGRHGGDVEGWPRPWRRRGGRLRHGDRPGAAARAAGPARRRPAAAGLAGRRRPGRLRPPGGLSSVTPPACRAAGCPPRCGLRAPRRQPRPRGRRRDDPGRRGARRRPEDAIVLRQALAGPAPRRRAVVVLRYYEDLTERETAEAPGISLWTVKSQPRDALARLRVSAGRPSASTPARHPSPAGP